MLLTAELLNDSLKFRGHVSLSFRITLKMLDIPGKLLEVILGELLTLGPQYPIFLLLPLCLFLFHQLLLIPSKLFLENLINNAHPADFVDIVIQQVMDILLVYIKVE
jgi:hypothetical protein